MDDFDNEMRSQQTEMNVNMNMTQSELRDLSKCFLKLVTDIFLETNDVKYLMEEVRLIGKKNAESPSPLQMMQSVIKDVDFTHLNDIYATKA